MTIFADGSVDPNAGVGARPENTGMNGKLQDIIGRKFPDEVATGWDAVNLEICDVNDRNKQLGGALLVAVTTEGPGGPHVRYMEISDKFRPLNEADIGKLGKVAVLKKAGLSVGDPEILSDGYKPVQALAQPVKRRYRPDDIHVDPKIY